MDDKVAGAGYPNGGGGFPGGPYGPYGAVGYGSGYGGGNESPWLPPPIAAPARPNNFHTVSLGLLVLLPALIYFGISLGYALLFHKMPALCWTFTGLCMCLSATFMSAKPVREGPRYWFNVGSLCLLATLSANLAGQWNMRTHFSMYWAYTGQREYSNVLPGEAALSHLDAGKIFFNTDARVDVQHASEGLAVGQERYCVAPIVGKTPSTTIEYWAAGIDCCSQAGGFTCNEAANPNVHSALVYLDSGPKQQWLASFKQAAREVGAAHGLTPSEDALFVAWVQDPDAAQQLFWKSGMSFLAGGSLAYIGVSAVVGIALHFGRRAAPAMKKNKLESRSL